MQNQRATSLVSGCNKSIDHNLRPGLHDLEHLRHVANCNDWHLTQDIAIKTGFELSRLVSQDSCNDRHAGGSQSAWLKLD